VRLEPLHDDHREPLRAAAGDPRIWTWMLEPSPAADPVVFDGWFDAALTAAADGREGPFCTIDRTSGRVVGSTRFMTLRPEHRGLEIGWTWLHPDAWRTGINRGAKVLQLEHAFERLGCLRVELKTHAANARSRAAMERLGATFEGILRRYQITPGIGDGVRDSAFYSVTDLDWPAVRAGLSPPEASPPPTSAPRR
jgi:RimJ/RimL family protein N-acetyltransferase